MRAAVEGTKAAGNDVAAELQICRPSTNIAKHKWMAIIIPKGSYPLER